MKHRLLNHNKPFYRLNATDTIFPLQYKTIPRSKEHRHGREFTIEIKRDKLKNVNNKCEVCTAKVNLQTAEFHHILSLGYAFHYFPQIPKRLLKSKHNCRVLCKECHINIHKNDSLIIYTAIAANFSKILKKWETNPPAPLMSRKNQRRIAQFLEKERRKNLKK